MAELYVLLIMKGLRTLNQVPRSIRAKVKNLLIEAGLEDLIEK